MMVDNAELGLLGCHRDIGFLNQEHNPVLAVFGDLNFVAGLPDQVWDIDHRKRIGTVHFEKVTGWHRLQRLSRFQCG